ncbi:MAG: DivIVA domain-containing protein [Desulfobulbaceae bacterium]|nr:MAG: DivIVA domain-containing protein [Desulfobulbaceae bacterium]
MALTPDDIAQKAFTPRFRGIDPVEVREFLLLAAAQIADLHDQITQQKEQIGEQEKELALAADDKKSFDDVLDVFKQKIDTLTAQLGETRQQQANRDEEFKRVQQLLEEVQRERDKVKGELDRAQTSLSEAGVFKQKIDTLTAQLGETRQQQANRDEEFKRVQQLLEEVQRERDKVKGELGRAQTSLSEAESKSRMSRAALEGMRNKIVVIEAEKAELISAAEQHQKTLDEGCCRPTDKAGGTKLQAERMIAEATEKSDELAEETKLQEKRIIAETKEEIARLRDTASQELVVIREDIDKLNAQRRQLHTDLRDLLHDHLNRLSEYATGSGGPTTSEYDELFQKIDFTELAELEDDAALDEIIGNEQPSDEQAGESEENLRTKLKDGGIAYLSDE